MSLSLSKLCFDAEEGIGWTGDAGEGEDEEGYEEKPVHSDRLAGPE